MKRTHKNPGMTSIKGRELKKIVAMEGVDRAARRLIVCLQEGEIRPEDCSIRDIAEAFIVNSSDNRSVGRAWVQRLGPQKSGGFRLVESESAVSVTQFSNITGQIIYNRLMESYQQAEFVASRLVEEYQTDLNGEKIAGVTELADDVNEVHEGMPFPHLGVGEDWIETPKTTKRGLIVSATKEAIFFDRTGRILERASKVGDVLGRKKEKLVLQTVMGLTNSYKWRGNSYNTYQGTTPWINVKSGLTLQDWEDIDTIEQMFSEMLEPNTGEPIVITPSQILHMPAKTHLLRHIFRATSLETRTQSSNEARIGPNTLDQYELVSSKFAYRELIASGVSASNAKDYWFMGDFKKAFAWQYNWPVEVVQAPSNSEAEFNNDIAYRWKASERGSAVVKDPRYVIKVYNS